MGAQVSLFRIPRGGGPVKAYQPDSLAPVGWASLQPIPAVRRLLGVDLDERVFWILDRDGNLVFVDLETRGVRRLLTGVTGGILGPDGSLFVADSARRIVRVVRRQPVRFHEPLPTAPRTMFGAVNDQLIAITTGSPVRLITVSVDQPLQTTRIPAGETTATAWGDLVAVAADSAVLLYETGGERRQTAITSVEHARRVAFSPSGHRIYVTQENDELRVFDRFSLAELPPIKLPGPPREFRVDASGRWLLAQPATGDSVWIADLATGSVAATVSGDWAPDLPLVAGAATLVVRQGGDLGAFDLRQTPPPRLATLKGGGDDLWLAAAWVPPERQPAAVAAAESATVVQDSALQADSTLSAGDSLVIYLQVSRTQNPEWADLLTGQLKADGYPASVLAPKEEEDGYRVVVGPYPSRESAESTGRRLGRAYFLLRLPAKRP